MSTLQILATVCAGYAAYAVLFIKLHARPVPRWWLRMVAALRRWLRAVAAAPGRVSRAARVAVRRWLAAARLRRALISFSLHLLIAPKGVVR